MSFVSGAIENHRSYLSSKTMDDGRYLRIVKSFGFLMSLFHMTTIMFEGDCSSHSMSVVK